MANSSESLESISVSLGSHPTNKLPFEGIIESDSSIKTYPSEASDGNYGSISSQDDQSDEDDDEYIVGEAIYGKGYYGMLNEDSTDDELVVQMIERAPLTTMEIIEAGEIAEEPNTFYEHGGTSTYRIRLDNYGNVIGVPVSDSEDDTQEIENFENILIETLAETKNDFDIVILDNVPEFNIPFSPYLDEFMIIPKADEGIEIPMMAENENPREGNMDVEVNPEDAELAAKIKAALLEAEFDEQQAQNQDEFIIHIAQGHTLGGIHILIDDDDSDSSSEESFSSVTPKPSSPERIELSSDSSHSWMEPYLNQDGHPNPFFQPLFRNKTYSIQHI